MLNPDDVEVLLGPGVGAPVEHRRADEQADVADADGEERLQRGAGVGLVLPPVADEHERAQAHDLPAEDELDHVLGEHHHEHPGREQRDGGEEVRVATVAAHVLERVDLHEQRDERDEEQHHHATGRRCARRSTARRRRSATTSTCGSPARRRPSPASSVRWIHCTAAPTASTVAAAIEATPTSEPLIGRRLPKRMMTAKAMPGMTGISQAFSRNHPARDHRHPSRTSGEGSCQGLTRFFPRSVDDTDLPQMRVIPSSPRAGRGRSSGGCGRRAAPSPGRRRPRRRRRR